MQSLWKCGKVYKHEINTDKFVDSLFVFIAVIVWEILSRENTETNFLFSKWYKIVCSFYRSKGDWERTQEGFTVTKNLVQFYENEIS